jgi:hypothetical protein
MCDHATPMAEGNHGHARLEGQARAARQRGSPAHPELIAECAPSDSMVALSSTEWAAEGLKERVVDRVEGRPTRQRPGAIPSPPEILTISSLVVRVGLAADKGAAVDAWRAECCT